MSILEFEPKPVLCCFDRLQCPPRSAGASRKNPERASRRLTRSMSGVEPPPAAAKEEELELCLEEELLEVTPADY